MTPDEMKHQTIITPYEPSEEYRRLELRASQAEAQLRALRDAMIIAYGKENRSAIDLVERIAAGLLASGGF